MVAGAPRHVCFACSEMFRPDLIKTARGCDEILAEQSTMKALVGEVAPSSWLKPVRGIPRLKHKVIPPKRTELDWPWRSTP